MGRRASQVRDIMTSRISTVDADASLAQASRQMRDEKVGFLAVKKADRVLGVITDRDLVVRGMAGGSNIRSARVRDVMTPGVVTITAIDSIETAAKRMEENGVLRLLVLNQNGLPVGVVSIGDIAARQIEKELAGEILAEVRSYR